MEDSTGRHSEFSFSIVFSIGCLSSDASTGKGVAWSNLSYVDSKNAESWDSKDEIEHVVHWLDASGKAASHRRETLGWPWLQAYTEEYFVPGGRFDGGVGGAVVMRGGREPRVPSATCISEVHLFNSKFQIGTRLACYVKYINI